MLGVAGQNSRDPQRLVATKLRPVSKQTPHCAFARTEVGEPWGGAQVEDVARVDECLGCLLVECFEALDGALGGNLWRDGVGIVGCAYLIQR